MTHPFTFVRAHPAKGLVKGVPPNGHGALAPDRLTGRIEYRFRTMTPMLAPDSSRREEIPVDPDKYGNARTHPVFSLRVDAADGAVVAPTTVRNALGSAYEIVTNSPMRQFGGRRVPAGSTLWPTRDRATLSPADRVLGWGSESGNGGWRAQLAVLEVRFDKVVEGGRTSTAGRDAIRHFKDRNGLALAVMGAPQPRRSSRYWVNGKIEGEVAGRKVYLQHTPVFGDSDYWDPQRRSRVWEEKAYTGRSRSNQNRSVRGWIKPGAEFVVELELVNVAEVDAGALLWLLTLDSAARAGAQPAAGADRRGGHYLHIGGGRPLGFGSVQVFDVQARLFSGSAWRDHWRKFTLDGAPPEAMRAPAQRLVEVYTAHLESDYGTAFEAIPFIAEFLAASRGPANSEPIRFPPPAPRRRY